MKILVTGGAGFIGSNLAERLLGEGHEVKVLDDFSSGRRENIEEFKADIELIEGSILDLELLRRIFKDVAYVFHEAAFASVQRSLDDPATSFAVNAQGALNILIAARDTSVRRVIYAASSSVYGNQDVAEQVESLAPEPLSPYATAKLSAEYLMKSFARSFKMQTVCLRYFNVFGPRQDPNSSYSAVIPLFIKAVLSNQSPIIYGDGQQSRDFTYVDNVVRANMLAMESEKVGQGETINIALGQNRSLLDLLEAINSLLDTKIEPKFETARQGDVMRSQASIAKAQSLLNYSPVVGFEDGLKKAIAWYREH